MESSKNETIQSQMFPIGKKRHRQPKSSYLAAQEFSDDLRLKYTY